MNFERLLPCSLFHLSSSPESQTATHNFQLRMIAASLTKLISYSEIHDDSLLKTSVIRQTPALTFALDDFSESRNFPSCLRQMPKHVCYLQVTFALDLTPNRKCTNLAYCSLWKGISKITQAVTIFHTN